MPVWSLPWGGFAVSALEWNFDTKTMENLYSLRIIQIHDYGSLRLGKYTCFTVAQSSVQQIFDLDSFHSILEFKTKSPYSRTASSSRGGKK